MNFNFPIRKLLGIFFWSSIWCTSWLSNPKTCIIEFKAIIKSNFNYHRMDLNHKFNFTQFGKT